MQIFVDILSENITTIDAEGSDSIAFLKGKLREGILVDKLYLSSPESDKEDKKIKLILVSSTS